MKINWGTGIVLALIGFISFIMYFIITMSTNDKYNHDLVVEDYYQKELEFEADINKEKNALALKENIVYNKTPEGVVITFPSNLDPKNITGKVFLYRPSNKQFDFEVPISLSNHNLLIPDNRLLDGRWNIKVDWQYNNTSYLYKKEMSY
ncbi:cytochrome Cbb3 oxidase maturation protein CcoH [Mangrovimonas yunxiaonensis]|uniref:Cytochrome Cbb3 oxidase maturation protein CcoH n=1 Tax=Mangrovimonas yunxiaonensis TaxID=1197477 RepID=A0A084TNJ1_9FLAO|nr:FixH family protein [Mangrovimonas yunxiaonensis]KFB02277.1 cytochrome Cbb3 oxidase maturation protein CcoH [Mangrovimonas yunxiaonensis]GGH39366.1 cytochrome Cbb3 oxidase maturation protein CcoH [Mangrovimonas yunxiaonensis]